MPGKTKRRRALPPGLETIYQGALSLHTSAAQLRVALEQDANGGAIERSLISLRAHDPELDPATRSWPALRWSREEALREAREIEGLSNGIIEALSSRHYSRCPVPIPAVYGCLLRRVRALRLIERSAA